VASGKCDGACSSGRHQLECGLERSTVIEVDVAAHIQHLAGVVPGEVGGAIQQAAAVELNLTVEPRCCGGVSIRSRLPVNGLNLTPMAQLLVTEIRLSLPSYAKVSVATVVPPEPPVLYTTPVRLLPV
jgi:hypothetical protein